MEKTFFTGDNGLATQNKSITKKQAIRKMAKAMRDSEEILFNCFDCIFKLEVEVKTYNGWGDPEEAIATLSLMREESYGLEYDCEIGKTRYYMSYNCEWDAEDLYDKIFDVSHRCTKKEFEIAEKWVEKRLMKIVRSEITYDPEADKFSIDTGIEDDEDWPSYDKDRLWRKFVWGFGDMYYSFNSCFTDMVEYYIPSVEDGWEYYTADCYSGDCGISLYVEDIEEEWPECFEWLGITDRDVFIAECNERQTEESLFNA